MNFFRFPPILFFVFVLLCFNAENRQAVANESIQIQIWYGDNQRFGHLGGHPQRWINILGNVSPWKTILFLQYSLNNGPEKILSFQEDKHRLARPGDFNVEILRSDLNPGTNIVHIKAVGAEQTMKKEVKVIFHDNDGEWRLPYHIDWSRVENISDAAQIVDGKWELTKKGVRTKERYYDRVLAVGDGSWSNYELTTTVTIHDYTPPKVDPNFTNVTHVAIAMRWPGHDPDGLQPSRKWHPLGATAEFRLSKDLKQARWRIFDGQRKYKVESKQRRVIELERTYYMKHRVETLADGRSYYRVKWWPKNEQEPVNWDFERYEPDDIQFGSALLIAHHTDVTFGNIHVIPVSSK